MSVPLPRVVDSLQALSLPLRAKDPWRSTTRMETFITSRQSKPISFASSRVGASTTPRGRIGNAMFLLVFLSSSILASIYICLPCLLATLPPARAVWGALGPTAVTMVGCNGTISRQSVLLRQTLVVSQLAGRLFHGRACQSGINSPSLALSSASRSISSVILDVSQPLHLSDETGLTENRKRAWLIVNSVCGHSLALSAKVGLR